MIMSSVAASVAETTLPETGYFSVYAAAEPGVMPRVLELFAKRGLVPSRWRSILSGDAGEAELAIEIEMQGLGAEATNYIAACLRQIASVEVVSASWRARGVG
jgi:acetolactate synthase small subunit